MVGGRERPSSTEQLRAFVTDPPSVGKNVALSIASVARSCACVAGIGAAL